MEKAAAHTQCKQHAPSWQHSSMTAFRRIRFCRQRETVQDPAEQSSRTARQPHAVEITLHAHSPECHTKEERELALAIQERQL